MVIRVAVVGATGRMGLLTQRLVDEADDLELHAALSSADSLDALAGADVVFDVTVPAASPGIVNAALDLRIPRAMAGTARARCWSRCAREFHSVRRRCAAN